MSLIFWCIGIIILLIWLGPSFFSCSYVLLSCQRYWGLGEKDKMKKIVMSIQ
ncbi:hypothetical protein F975_00840 [Acinetobacter sp. ANC 3789]|nr:hypothetical protein F975_00840 [Acinetobacter sp. ANC 3789]